jgi:hypothetical protein
MNPTGNETYVTPFERAILANQAYFSATDYNPNPHFYEVNGSFIFGVAERRCHFNHDEDCGV